MVLVLLLQEEQAGWQSMDPEDRPKFTPQAFDTLRHVPMYAQFIQERFDRCLDLYLCPRWVSGLFTIGPPLSSKHWSSRAQTRQAVLVDA